jgi:hypothetical protein
VAEVRDWQQSRAQWVRLLEESTGTTLGDWNDRIGRADFGDEQALRAWLTQQRVTGYAQTLLVMERFGYPDFFTASAAELIDAQYADRPQLRPIFDAIVAAAAEFGDVVVQARKTYVSLVSPHRTFARIQATTKVRVDLALRLEGEQPGGRLHRSTIHETMKVQIGLTSLDQVDPELMRWLRQAYDESTPG